TDQVSSDNNAYSRVFVGIYCDAGVTSLMKPLEGEVFVLGAGFSPSALFQWAGIPSSVSNLPVHLEIHRCNDATIAYQADSIVPQITQDAPAVFTFSQKSQGKKITDLPEGCYTITVNTNLSCDQNLFNNTQSASFTISSNINCDVAAVSVIRPSPDEKILQGSDFKPVGILRWQGTLETETNIPVRLEIRRCSDNKIITSYDSTIPLLKRSDGDTRIYWPTIEKMGGLANLVPDCYMLSLVTQLSCDAHPSNDTATTSFSIVSDPAEVHSPSAGSVTFTLDQNFPNPFTNSSAIHYYVPENGRATLRIYEITGRAIQSEMVNQPVAAGDHDFILHTHDLQSGIYFYQMTFINEKGEATTLSKRMTILK
ncbi:MAG: T9SS type A sorting domain-containing protein, partial [Ignavibacteriota bacterium]